jgi:hypothetical protein
MLWTNAALGRAGLALVAAGLLACEPIGPIAGGELSGELQGPPDDWSFASGEETLELETRPEDPHSVTVWYVVHDGKLYIPSRHPERKRWVRNVLEDPRVRVRVEGRLYPGRIARASDPAELEPVVPALLEKYGIEPPEPGGEREVWLFRIDPAPPPLDAGGS